LLPSTAEVRVVVFCATGTEAVLDEAVLGARLDDLRGGGIVGCCRCCCGLEIGVAALAFSVDNNPEYEEKATVRIKSAHRTRFFNTSIFFLVL
jgi:hypothetical protein